jgi:hypothetical protein
VYLDERVLYHCSRRRVRNSSSIMAPCYATSGRYLSPSIWLRPTNWDVVVMIIRLVYSTGLQCGVYGEIFRRFMTQLFRNLMKVLFTNCRLLSVTMNSSCILVYSFSCLASNSTMLVGKSSWLFRGSRRSRCHKSRATLTIVHFAAYTPSTNHFY